MGDFNFEKINWNTWSTSSPETHIDFKSEMKPNCFGENKVFFFIWFTI
jgi:hypothetical protein